MRSGTVRSIERYLAAREARRARLEEASRRLRRQAQSVMARLHGGAGVRSEIRALRRGSRRLTAQLRAEGAWLDASLARDAFQEVAEAELLVALVARAPLPGPKELGIDVESYLLGLGDVIGELRRLSLTGLAADDLDLAEEYLLLMEALYHTLMRFEAPRAIVPLKPKQDAARSLLERTRGEVVMAKVGRRNRLSSGGWR